MQKRFQKLNISWDGVGLWRSSGNFTYLPRLQNKRIFKFSSNIFKAMEELSHVFFLMLIKNFKLDIQAIILNAF